LGFVINARIAKTTVGKEALIPACSNNNVLGIMLALHGYIDEAYELLLADPNPIFFAGVAYQPSLHAFRADNRFMALAAQLELVDYWLESDHWPDFCSEEDLPYDCKEIALATVASG